MFSTKRFALLSLTFGVVTAGGQSRIRDEGIPKAEIAVDYSFMRANATPGKCGCFNLNGGSAEFATRAYRNLSVVADITGDHARTTSIPDQALSVLSYTGGPRFSYPLRHSQRSRITPFVQGLAGVVRGFNAPFPNGNGTISSSANGLAILVGGGVDIAIGHSLAIRALQVDYGLNHVPNNANNTENLLRVSAGLVFRIAEHKRPQA